MSRLAPLSEVPDGDEAEELSTNCSKKSQTWKNWLRTHFSTLFVIHKKSDLRILLSVLACPLFPVNPLPKLPISHGLDPMAISAVFSEAEYVEEKPIMGTDCFVLKLYANHEDLTERSDNTAEMIKHVMFGYFSQRSGLLVCLEDSYLTRIQYPGSSPTYWETTMCTRMEDYRPVEGVMIAHLGYSSVIITRFGDNLRLGPAITRMEESYVIDDLAFNVPGLSMDCFIPPEHLQKDYPEEHIEFWRSPWHQ